MTTLGPFQKSYLVVFLLLALVGCGGGGDGEAVTPSEPMEPAQQTGSEGGGSGEGDGGSGGSGEGGEGDGGEGEGGEGSGTVIEPGSQLEPTLTL
ncbi:MAG: hypothetical protein KTR18_07805 [Acidiferrobacterales bacterium]|nr:hypothetical protein [Acidiferrobacterales bacterium]